MEVLNFVIAVVGLIIAVMAFQRTGGVKDPREKAQLSFFQEWKRR